MAQESGNLIAFDDRSQLCALTVPGIDTIVVRVYSCSDSSILVETPFPRKNPPSSLCWAPSENFKQVGSVLSNRLLAIGSSGGSIIVYSPAEDERLVTLNNGHNGPVTDIKFDPLNRSILWSTGKDGKVIRWDLSSGISSGKFSLKDRSIQKSLPFVLNSKVNLAAASHSLYVIPSDCLSEATTGILRPDVTFPGHTTQIQSLITAEYNDNTYLVSFAETDRFINVYSLAKRSVCAVLPAQSDVTNIAVSPDGLFLAASTSDGIVEVFDRPFVGSKSASSRRKSNLAKPSSSEIKFEINGHPSPIADVSFDGSVLIASWRDRGSLWRFERVSLQDDEGKLISEITVNLQSRPTALASAASDAGKRGLYNEAEAVVTEGDNLEDVEFSEAGPLPALPPSDSESEQDDDFIPLSSNEDAIAEPTLEEQLLASSAIDTTQKPKRLPKSGTVATVLSQALLTNDEALLESCLQNRDSDLIAKTVRRMEPSLAVALLSHLATKVSRTPTRTAHLNTWIKWTLITHAGRISHKDLNSLSVLHATLETKARTLPRLLDIQGRLELLSSQMDLRKSVLNGVDRFDGANDSDNDQFNVEYTEYGYESLSDEGPSD